MAEPFNGGYFSDEYANVAVALQAAIRPMLISYF